MDKNVQTGFKTRAFRKWTRTVKGAFTLMLKMGTWAFGGLFNVSELSSLSNIKLPYDRKLRHWKLMQHLILTQNLW